MSDWNDKGCEICRQIWLQGDQLPKLAECYERHSFLHQCTECGSYWEQFERFVDTISEEDARRIYGTFNPSFQERKMMSETFIPLNDLESSLIQARDGRKNLRSFLGELLVSNVYVCSQSEVQSDRTGFHPLFFDKGDEVLMAVFTSGERAKKYSGEAPYCLMMNGLQLFKSIPDGIGIVVNPRSTVGLEIPPSGIESIRAEYGVDSPSS